MKRLKKKHLLIAAGVLVLLIAIGSLSDNNPNPSVEDTSAPVQTDTPNQTPEIPTQPSESPTLSPPSESVTPSTPPVEETTTPYTELAKDKSAYLLFLEIIGTCYKDNSMSEELFAKMEENSDIQALVQDVLNYRYQNGNLSPDFSASFSAFWTNEVASDYPEIVDALTTSFDLQYQLVEKIWTIEENAETIAFHAGDNPPDTDDDFEWLSAIGHLYPGVELYIVTDNISSLYGYVVELDTEGTQVQLYLYEADRLEWFERRTPLFSDVLKVRSNDPQLPQN